MTTRLTFSQAPRIELCPPSAALPETRQADPDEARDYGTALHTFLRDVSLMGRDAALEAVPVPHREAMERVNLDDSPAMKPDQYAVEVSFAWDPTTDTGRELGRGDSSRDYSSVAPTEWAGTADLIGLTDDAVIVWDYKTGWKALAAPGDHLQLLGYAVAAARTYKRDAAWVGFIRWPKGAEPYFVSAKLDLLDLDAAADRLRQAAAAVSPSAMLVEGEHCQYCPSFSVCPAKAHLLGALVKATVAIDPRSPEIAPSTDLFPMPLTAQNFPEVLRRFELTQQLLERVRAQLENFAGNTPISLGGDEFFGKVANQRDKIDPDIGAEILAERFGQPVAEEAVERKYTLTKEALKSALQSWARCQPKPAKGEPKPPGITKLMEEAVEAIRKANGVSVSTFYSFKRFKAPKGVIAKKDAA